MNTAAIIKEAKQWLGTPYHNNARVKGVGVDCAMLLLEVYSRVGVIPNFDPGEYSPQFGLHRSEEKLISIVLKYASEIEAPEPGCCVIFKFGRCYSHAGIMVDSNLLIHAVANEGFVNYASIKDASLIDRAPKFFKVCL
jgi:cell wall-associated NlpC family hydrolase